MKYIYCAEIISFCDLWKFSRSDTYDKLWTFSEVGKDSESTSILQSSTSKILKSLKNFSKIFINHNAFSKIFMQHFFHTIISKTVTERQFIAANLTRFTTKVKTS